jgi:hypothetical protein
MQQWVKVRSIRSAVNFEPPALPFGEEARKWMPESSAAATPIMSTPFWSYGRQTYGPTVLVLLPLEKTRTGNQAEAGPNRLVRR